MDCTARILVIEDDVALNDQLTELLQGRGYTVSQCFDGEQGLLAALAPSVDLILLDVMLPVRNGFSLLKLLRQSQQTPVIMLTARGAEEERIKGFSQGADDYLAKPFSFTELVLRIEALLRRARGQVTAVADAVQLEYQELWLDRRQQQAGFRQTRLELTPIQFKLLWTLMQNRGEVLSKPFLYQQVLEREFSRYDRSLDMHLSRVRRKLIEAGMGATCLQTVHGTGYLFK
ncbi:two component transcriptional regulator [Oceanimonas sp. GK1]|uniref:response regulator transcription factor n=1 Tax=Oceanimonas sp. (strain GK1 / IBRC-M 10197) TaxID=511062 RepID=UPI0002494B4D|nr:response regulator transcription factor [Oceanimonas sp. GK1]AEY00338.1 two component transcriptional regulator [Oceanimonas sp. GK1]